jgi:hypothetical protein
LVGLRFGRFFAKLIRSPLARRPARVGVQPRDLLSFHLLSATAYRCTVFNWFRVLWKQKRVTKQIFVRANIIENFYTIKTYMANTTHGGYSNGRCWYIIWPLGLMYAHLVYFMPIIGRYLVIWYILCLL